MMLASEMARGFRPDAEGRLLVCPYWAGTMPVLRGPEGGKLVGKIYICHLGPALIL